MHKEGIYAFQALRQTRSEQYHQSDNQKGQEQSNNRYQLDEPVPPNSYQPYELDG